MEENVVKIDLLKGGNIEIASVDDVDLMQIRCFATTEGLNLNKLLFRREILAQSYQTFIDKPVVIVEDRNYRPTGHGFNFTTKTFDMDKRRYIGHITNAFPVIVDDQDNIHYLNGLDFEDYPMGQYRIVVDIVVYKRYLGVITNELELLHKIGQLNFSMEANVHCDELEDGVKDCSRILFTGLAIVSNPAFENSKSIQVAEKEKEENLMDYEKAYNDLQVEFAELKEQKENLEAQAKADMEQKETEVASLQDAISEIKEDLANKNAELAEVKAENEVLKPFKAQVELAEKENLGKERVAKLEKFGVKDADAMEVAELSKEEFADRLIEASDNMEVKVAEVDDLQGIPQHNIGMKSDKDKLIELLGSL